MKIYINNIELDFKLENEKDLSQVLRSLQEWLEGEGHHIESVLVNGAALDWDDPDRWKDTPVAEVEKIELTSLNSLELKVQYLHALHQFFMLLKRSLEEKNRPLMNEVMRDYQSMRTYLNAVFPGRKEGEGQTLAEKIDNFLSETGLLTSGELPQDPGELLALISSLIGVFSELIRELTSPLSEILAAARSLKEIVPQLGEVSILLQTGKDKDAMDTVIRFTECSQKLIRIYPYLKTKGLLDTQNAKVDNLGFDEYYIDLNRILLELTQAFSANDSVLIGDLLEYEVAPRLENLIVFLNELNDGR